MGDLLFAEQDAFVAKLVDDQRIGFPDGLSVEPFGCGVIEPPVSQDGAVDFQLFADAGLVVVLAVSGSGVEQSGAVGGGDIVGGDDSSFAVDERVLIDGADELIAEERLDKLARGHARAIEDAIDPVAMVADQRVLDLGIHRDRKIRRQRPGRRRPHDEHEVVVLAQPERFGQPFQTGGGKLDVDAGVGDVLILQLRVGQRGLV